MKIRVEQRHIRNGCKGSPGTCPVALALEEQAGGFWAVGLDGCVQLLAEPWRPSSSVVMQFTIPAVGEFVDSYDSLSLLRLPARPFSFDLPWQPEPASRAEELAAVPARVEYDPAKVSPSILVAIDGAIGADRIGPVPMEEGSLSALDGRGGGG